MKLQMLVAGAAALLSFSQPASAQFRGAWLPAPGSLRAEISLIGFQNDRWFCGNSRGHCRPGERDVFSDLTTREESRTHSVYTRLEASPRKNLALQAEIPFHVLEYKRFAGGSSPAEPPLDAEGIGDLKLSLRTGSSWGKWALSMGYGIEFPTGDFSSSAFIIPLGQGTLNHEVFLEGGRSLHPFEGFTEIGLLYRFRGTYVTDFGEEVEFGNETHGVLGGGFRALGPCWVKVQARGFLSGRSRTNIPGVPEGDFRSVWSLVPSVFAGRGGFLGEIWAEFPVAGRNTPADPSFGLKLGVELQARSRAQGASPGSATMAP